ncbi:DUF4159 domain-containing protein [bacterium]|nr:DUF4159 domain-containing protein [bacterium]
MNNDPKTAEPSGIISLLDMDRLEHETRRYLYAGFVIALLFQLALAPFIHYGRLAVTHEKYRIVKLIDIITLPEEPQEFEPSQPFTLDRNFLSQLRNAESHFRFKTPHGDFRSIENEEYRGFLSKLGRDLDTETKRLAESNMLPDSLAVEKRFDPGDFGYTTKITRELERGFSLRDEMLSLDDIEAMGQFKGFVIQDPSDRKNIKGFVHIPKFIREMNPRYNLAGAVDGLSEAFNYYTGISVKIDDPVCLCSEELSTYPMIYLTTDTTEVLELKPSQYENLGKYLKNGGFAIVDNGTPWKEYSPAEATLINILRISLGDDFRMEPVPIDHPIYHCFFDFTIAPEGAEKMTPPDENPVVNPWGEMLHIPVLEKVRKAISDNPGELWGVWLGERLVAVYSNKGYGHVWRDGVTLSKYRDFSSSDRSRYNFNPQLKLGVNLMVYGLIQRGGITKQVVDYHAYSSIPAHDESPAPGGK